MSYFGSYPGREVTLEWESDTDFIEVDQPMTPEVRVKVEMPSDDPIIYYNMLDRLEVRFKLEDFEDEENFTNHLKGRKDISRVESYDAYGTVIVYFIADNLKITRSGNYNLLADLRLVNWSGQKIKIWSGSTTMLRARRW